MKPTPTQFSLAFISDNIYGINKDFPNALALQANKWRCLIEICKSWGIKVRVFWTYDVIGSSNALNLTIY